MDATLQKEIETADRALIEKEREDRRQFNARQRVRVGNLIAGAERKVVKITDSIKAADRHLDQLAKAGKVIEQIDEGIAGVAPRMSETRFHRAEDQFTCTRAYMLSVLHASQLTVKQARARLAVDLEDAKRALAKLNRGIKEFID
jgi:hypothetical protein